MAEAEICQGLLDDAERRLHALVDRTMTDSHRANARLGLASILGARGQRSAARELRTAAIAILRSQVATTGCAQAELALGWGLVGLADDQRRLAEDTEAAAVALAESQALFERCGADDGLAAILAARAVIHLDQGETLEAARCARESLSLAERIGSRVGVARALQLVGRTTEGNDKSGSPLVERAISLWQEMTRPLEAAEAWLDLAWLTSERENDPGRAMGAARQALSLARRHGFAAVEAAALLGLARAYGRAGDTERAEGYAMEAAAAAERTDDARVRRQIEWHTTLVRPGVSERPMDREAEPILPPAHASPPSPPASDAPSAPPLLVRLLGPLAVEGPCGTLGPSDLRPKEQRVLARLALSPGEVVPRDELLDLFWHQSPVASAERSLRTVVSSLRNSLRRLLDGPSVAIDHGPLGRLPARGSGLRGGCRPVRPGRPRGS